MSDQGPPNQQSLPLRASTQQALPPPPPQLHMQCKSITISKICPKNNAKELFGIMKVNQQYLFYEYDERNEKFEIHQCECQTKIFDTYLEFQYSVHCEALNAKVFFAYNRITERYEQFIFNSISGGFEQVDRPEVQLLPRCDSRSNVLAYIPLDENEHIVIEKINDQAQKSYFKFGQYLVIPPSTVKCFINNEKAEDDTTGDNSSTVDVNNSAKEGDTNDVNYINFREYLSYVPKFTVTRCDHHCIVVRMLSHTTGKSETFAYIGGGLQKVRCVCFIFSDNILDSELSPIDVKYIEDTETHVLLARNSITGAFEQFAYDPEHRQFVQVYHHKLFSDSTYNYSNILFTSEEPKTIFMRGSMSRLQKEYFCSRSGKFQLEPPTPVKTFALQKLEWDANKDKARRKRLQEENEAEKVESSKKAKMTNEQSSIPTEDDKISERIEGTPSTISQQQTATENDQQDPPSVAPQ